MRKVYDLKALDVDQKQKEVKIAFAQVEDVDKDNDVFDPISFNKSIKERGPHGSNEIWHLLDHTQNSFSALSKFKEISLDGKYLTGVSHFKNSFAWREVAWPIYEAGEATQHSIGFEILKDERRKDGVRIIKEARIYEGSLVLWGAQPDTPTLQVVKSLMNMEDDRSITAAEKIDEIVKAIHKGRYDDDTSLLIVELKRLQYLFDTKQTARIFTEPETTSTLPDETLNVLTAFTNSLKADNGRKRTAGAA
jgi:phage head maturation protease